MNLNFYTIGDAKCQIWILNIGLIPTIGDFLKDNVQKYQSLLSTYDNLSSLIRDTKNERILLEQIYYNNLFICNDR